MVYLDVSETDPKTLTVPSNALDNGAGKNASLNSKFVPHFDAYAVSGAQSSRISSATVSFSTSTGFNLYSLGGGLDTFGNILMGFQF